MTWTKSNIANGTLTPGAYANGVWVAHNPGFIGNAGLYYSTDGRAWTQSNITSGRIDKVMNASGVWMACYSYGTSYYSTDGKTWEQSSIASEGITCIENANANGLWQYERKQNKEVSIF